MTTPETETLDKMYLEWSQFTSARTKLELALQAELARVKEELKLWKPMTNEEAEKAIAEAVPIPISDEEINRIVARVTDPTYQPTEPEHVLMAAKIEQLRAKAKHEKDLRVMYQDLVYGVCNVIDRANGTHATKGNCIIYDQCAPEVQKLYDRLAACERERDRYKREIEACGNSAAFDWNVLERLDRLESAEAEARRLREALEELYRAMVEYQQDSEGDAPPRHRDMMFRAAAALQTGRTPHDDTPPQ